MNIEVDMCDRRVETLRREESVIDLITNNPRKIRGLEGYGLSVVERVPIEICPTEDNIHYLGTKREKLGNILEKT